MAFGIITIGLAFLWITTSSVFGQRGTSGGGKGPPPPPPQGLEPGSVGPAPSGQSKIPVASGVLDTTTHRYIVHASTNRQYPTEETTLVYFETDWTMQSYEPTTENPPDKINGFKADVNLIGGIICMVGFVLVLVVVGSLLAFEKWYDKRHSTATEDGDKPPPVAQRPAEHSIDGDDTTGPLRRDNQYTLPNGTPLRTRSRRDGEDYYSVVTDSACSSPLVKRDVKGDPGDGEDPYYIQVLTDEDVSSSMTIYSSSNGGSSNEHPGTYASEGDESLYVTHSDVVISGDAQINTRTDFDIGHTCDTAVCGDNSVHYSNIHRTINGTDNMTTRADVESGHEAYVHQNGVYSSFPANEEVEDSDQNQYANLHHHTATNPTTGDKETILRDHVELSNDMVVSNTCAGDGIECKDASSNNESVYMNIVIEKKK